MACSTKQVATVVDALDANVDDPVTAEATSDDKITDDTGRISLAEADTFCDGVNDVVTGLYEESVELKPEANKTGNDNTASDDEAIPDTILELAAVFDEAETDTERLDLVTDVGFADPETSSRMAGITLEAVDSVDTGPDGD
ncbi:hypothetical protein E4U42_004693 [Claviceps africana]|uniref:Uncharacterized protein n=1 Tax=Claviceps africana TaxID=83212 RepID=A0A8K0J4X0_9HYPO|nr:hypothetical protein E4U42_004693 [Claviceps africana]